MTFIRYSLLVFFFMLLLLGCQPAPSVNAGEHPGNAAHTLTPRPTPTPTPTPKPLPTASPLAPSPTTARSRTPAPTSTIAAVTCREDHGRVLAESLNSANLPFTLAVNVYLPPCYQPDPAAPYPLLVLLHGQSYDQQQWLDLGLAQIANNLISTGEIPPLIILMPYEENAWQNPYESAFDLLILDTLLPWAQEDLSACDQAACRAVGGISRGGSWALRLIGDHPEAFSIAGLHSAPPFTTDQNRLVTIFRKLTEDERPQLYIDVGDIDTYRGYIVELHDALSLQGIAHSWQMSSGGHDDGYWRAHLPEYLAWYGAQIARAEKLMLNEN